MSDEQMIYIDPEDDLTNVRTRLEGVESRHITLVIPAQTQLRSHVAWKLLHARARELGKDILIVSADPQIRSVAQAVKFRVANSLEAAQESKPRPSARPGRSSSPTKGRTTTTRNPRSHQLQSPEPWSFQSPNALGAQAAEGVDRTIPRLSSSFSADERTYGRGYDYRLDSPVLQPLTNTPIEEPDLLLEDFQQAEGIREAASQPGSDEEAPARADISAYKITPRPPSDDPFAFMDEKETGAGKLEQHGRAGLHNYDTQQHTIQDISDLPSGIRDNDDDDNIEYEGDLGDFVVHSDTTPKTIHHSWTEPTPDDEQDFVGPARTYGVRPRGSRSGQVPPLPRSQQIESEDALPPIENRPTRQPLRPSQPLGPRSVPLSPRPSKSLSPRPSKPLSRSDGLSARPSQPLASSRADPLSPRVSKALNNSARPGYQPPSRSSQPLSRSDALRAAPLENRTEMQAQPRSERPRPSKPLTPQQVARSAAPAARSKVAAPEKPRPQRPAAPQQKKGVFSGSTLLVTVIVLAFLLLAALAYLLPSADVRVGLPGRTYTHQVQLTLAANHSSSPNGVIGTNFTHNLDLKGSGTATGTTIVGTIPAQGYVIFTNNSTTISARILTDTVIATPSGIQFVTTSDAVVAPKGGNLQNLVQVPVRAGKPGEAGNVAPGSITFIPDSSLATIAQSSNAPQSAIELTVVNPVGITGGGAGNAPQVKQQDLDAAQAALSKQLQSNFMIWLKTQIGANDVIGLPSKTERLVNAPKANQILPSGTNTFPLELQGTYSVLVLRDADLQLAARAQLNTALAKEKAFKNYTMANGTSITIDHLTIKANGSEQILTFNATSQAVPMITSDVVKSLIVGKSVSEARQSLQEDVQLVAPKGTVQVDITTYPISLPIVPYRNDNIQVHFFAVQTPNGPSKSK